MDHCRFEGGDPAQEQQTCDDWDCDRPPCRKSEPDRWPAGTEAWSIDMIEHIPFGPSKARGEWEQVSRKPIRASVARLPGSRSYMCRFAAAMLRRLPHHGEADYLLCNDPRGDEDHWRWSRGQVYKQRGADPAGMVPEGAWSIRMCWENPPNHEVRYDKEIDLCTGYAE